jgi:signal transduction histidine kinase
MQDLRRRFRRRFAIAATAVTLVVAGGVAFLVGQTYWRMLLHIGDLRATEIAADFHAAATEQSADFIAAARNMTPAEIRAHPDYPRLTELARLRVRGTRVTRLSLHDGDGRILFSTTPAAVGTYPDNRAAFASARVEAGGAASVPALSSLNTTGATADRMLFHSVVSVPGGDGQRLFVSLFSDTAGYHVIIRRNLLLSIGVVVGALFAVLGMLIFYVGRDRVLQEQQARNAALTESVRMAEEANRLKSRFVASMGHELRTPLNAIIGFSEAMKHRIFGPLGAAKYEEYASTIHASGRHLLAVVDDILDMARIEGGKAVLHESVFSPRAALSNCAQLVAAEAERNGQLFTARIADGLPAVRGDEAKIKQIVLNLLSNAVRYTPRGGRVGLSAERTIDGALVIAVADNGIGIPADALQHVFEAFRQVEDAKVRKKGGLGLGLNIAKSFAELHGATLMLESEHGRGTTARLVIPPERLVAASPASLSAAA